MKWQFNVMPWTSGHHSVWMQLNVMPKTYPKCQRYNAGTLQLVRIIKEKSEEREMF